MLTMLTNVNDFSKYIVLVTLLVAPYFELNFIICDIPILYIPFFIFTSFGQPIVSDFSKKTQFGHTLGIIFFLFTLQPILTLTLFFSHRPELVWPAPKQISVVRIGQRVQKKNNVLNVFLRGVYFQNAVTVKSIPSSEKKIYI